MNWIFSWFLLNDEKGTPSWSLSLALYSFVITVLCIITMVLDGTVIPISNSFKLTVKSPPISFLVFFLPTCLGLYGFRKQEKSSTEFRYKELEVKNGDGKNGYVERKSEYKVRPKPMSQPPLRPRPPTRRMSLRPKYDDMPED